MTMKRLAGTQRQIGSALTEKGEQNKKMTNADKIRKMTDEELATLFIKVMAGNSGAQLDGIWQEKGMEENQRYFTRLNWLDWLK